jgi:hypothetical protein
MPSNCSYIDDSAIYHLHLSPHKSKIALADDARSLFELKRITCIIIDIARTVRFWLLSTHKADLGRCLPLTLHVLYHASLTHIELAENDFQSEQ